MDVGFIGLGNMGKMIVEGLLDGGQHVTVWARRAASTEAFEGRVAIAPSPAALGAASDVVGICVWDETDCDDVLLGDEGVFAGLRPGGVVAIHSTISPAACRRLEGEAKARGVSLIDAPVSIGATAPKLVVMVGGDADAVERARPALESFGDPVPHLGPVGSGQIAKLVNNTLLAAQIGLGDDATSFGVELGLDRAALVAVLAASSARGTWAGFIQRQFAETARSFAGRTGEWARKDVGLTLDVAAKAGLERDRIILNLGAHGVEVVDPT